MIIQSRLEGLAETVIYSDAVQFASRKVAAVSGDARRVLDICRRAMEIAEAASVAKAGQIPGRPPRVTINIIKEAIGEATSNPIQQHLRGLSLLMKVLLVCTINRIRHSGLLETTVGEVADKYKSLPLPVLVRLGRDKLGGRPCEAHIVPNMPALGSALLYLAGVGILTLDSQRTERVNKIRLAIGIEEILMSLSGDTEVGDLGIRLPQ